MTSNNKPQRNTAPVLALQRLLIIRIGQHSLAPRNTRFIQAPAQEGQPAAMKALLWNRCAQLWTVSKACLLTNTSSSVLQA